MANPFDALTQEPKPTGGGIEVEMDVYCLTCDEPTELVKYYPNDRCIRWECSQGHHSKITGLEL